MGKEGGNSHILAYRMCHFYGTQFQLENKNFGFSFQLVINCLVRFSQNIKSYFIFEVWKGVLVLNGNRPMTFTC